MLRWVCLLLLIFISGCAASTVKVKDERPQVDMTNSLNRVSYAAGYQLGDRFQNQKLSLAHEAVLLGLYDARKNLRNVMTKAEIKMILSDPKAYLLSDLDASAEESQKEGEAFLATNAGRDGVVVLDSGLQYRVLKEGQGKRPAATDRVRLKYLGTKIDGTAFTSTNAAMQSKEIALPTLVPGMAEGLQLMQEGAEWEFYIPSELAYADHGPLAKQTLIFKVELLEVISAE